MQIAIDIPSRTTADATAGQQYIAPAAGEEGASARDSLSLSLSLRFATPRSLQQAHRPTLAFLSEFRER